MGGPSIVFGVRIEPDEKLESTTEGWKNPRIGYLVVPAVFRPGQKDLFVSTPRLAQAISAHPEFLEKKVGEINGIVNKTQKRIELNWVFPRGDPESKGELPYNAWLEKTGLGAFCLHAVVRDVEALFPKYQIMFTGTVLPGMRRLLGRLRVPAHRPMPAYRLKAKIGDYLAGVVRGQKTGSVLGMRKMKDVAAMRKANVRGLNDPRRPKRKR